MAKKTTRAVPRTAPKHGTARKAYPKRPTPKPTLRTAYPKKPAYPAYAKKPKFPAFAVILLVIGVIWLLKELNILPAVIPWVPLVIIIIAIGMIVNRYKKK